SGIAILAVGIWVITSRSQYNSLLSNDNYVTVPGLMIAAGCLVIIVCVVGCVAVIKENRFILVSYLIMLVLIFILEIATGVVAVIYRSEVSKISYELEVGIRGKMNRYGFTDAVTKAIDDLQKEFKCCGDRGMDSWNNTSWKQSEISGNNSVPDSCCKSPSPGCGIRLHPNNIQEFGCISKLEKFFLDNLAILVGVAFGLAFSQV
ncbi:predicted protein, partial [Nematostella vectensis]